MSRPSFAIAMLVALAACSSGGGSGGPTPGSLQVTVTGLPSGNANISVTGPGGFNQAVVATTTLSGLTPGSYTVTAASADNGTTTYAPTPTSTNVNVPAGGTGSATVTYALASGSINLTITGLPGATAANVTVKLSGAGPTVTASGVVNDLLAGTYTVTAIVVPSGGSTYGGTPQSQQVVVTASLTPVPASVAYSVMTGQLAVTVSGLPGGGVPSVLVTGPFSYSHSIITNGLTTLTSLPLGDYTVTASGVTVAGLPYGPDTPVQIATLAQGSLNGSETVHYSAPNLVIDGMYITQATQKYTGAVPLVAARNGYLRVFVKANLANTFTPTVRVRWYVSGVLTQTDVIPAPGASVPLTVDEGTLNSSWNIAVPGSLVQSNLSVLADVDPTNVIAEGNEADNSFPVSGTPLALDVRTVNPFTITLLPITINGSAFTGNVTAGNQSTYLAFLKKIHPVQTVTITLHAPYTTATSGPLQSGDGNGAWEAVLTEIATLQAAEAAPPSQYYFGVVDPPYTGGVAGLGYIGFPAAMGWDKSIFDEVLAHEVGHNWGMIHAPCGNPANPTPNYPYPGAQIGIYGLDVATLTAYAPTTNFDIMSYCQPYWTDDFTWDSVLAYRAVNPMVVGAARAPEPTLLVWGRMHGSQLVLEPAFEVTTMPRMPEGSGPYTLQGVDANGATLFSYQFAGHEMADGQPGARSFTFAIPVSQLSLGQLAELRLSGMGHESRLRGGAAMAAMTTGGATPPTGAKARMVRGRAEFTWDHRAYPMAMIRDAATGEVLSFARGGMARVLGSGATLEVTLSDGVRSVREVVVAQ